MEAVQTLAATEVATVVLVLAVAGVAVEAIVEVTKAAAVEVQALVVAVISVVDADKKTII